MKKSRFALFQSAIALLLCISMLIGTTFAWFTDSVSSTNNRIAAGTLDVELEYLDANGNWQTVSGSDEVLDKDALWEPGHTEVAYLRISNQGNLALKYELGVGVLEETGSINAAGKAFYLSDYIRFGVIESETEPKYATREDALKALTDSQIISKGHVSTDNQLDKNGDTRYVTLVVYMPEDVGNDANHATGVNPPEIKLGLELVATQAEYEEDSFGKDYDAGANLSSFNFPATRIENSTSAGVEKDQNNQVTNGVTLTADQTSALIPEGVKLETGTNIMTLKVTSMDESDADITLGENEEQRSFDVHVTGIAADNTVPVAITIKEAAAKGLNAGNLTLYHVENGQSVLMELAGENPEHNQFSYDPATGDVTLYMATFSEVALVADTENAWNGTVAEEFAGGEGTAQNPYIIANADQFVLFGDRVSNDNSTYGSAHYKLVANINFGGAENTDKGIIFYPIGYTKVGGSIATLNNGDAPEAAYIIEDDTKALGSTVSESGTEWYTFGGAFKGTFDGAGHTIKNIYQNTWQMKGNYSGNYWNAAMGLFGYVNGGTIKNLSVSNFSSDGEFTPTGVIAAYAANATFENIAITYCNPRVYNTGNGGIVGIGGNPDDPDAYKLTFTNITIDNSNKISALWGSWDVACGGLVGMFRGAGHVYMTNCHVAAQIDVFNDVCGNYQYYWYRYAGMMIGTNKNMITDANGYTVPETSKFHATGCTVHFGQWNDYYYCELVANSLASYTHDHQFSRLEQITSLDEIKSVDTWTKAGNFLLISGDTKTCYHIVKNSDGTLKQHLHTDAGEETVNGKTVLKEDKQIVYLPFNQLFTGYGWGVKHIPVYNGEDYAFEGITILDRDVANSVKKFNSKVVNELSNKKLYTIGSIFEENTANTDKLPINAGAVVVSVTDMDETDGVVTAEYKPGTKWEEGTIVFKGTGKVKLTIQDYYYCDPTEIEVTITERQPAEKFKVVAENPIEVKLNEKLTVGKLFDVIDGADVDEKSITVTVGETKYTSGNTDWKKLEISFTASGEIEVTISDGDEYCAATTITVNVTVPEKVEKFEAKFTGDFLYRVGNQNTVALGSLFDVKDGVTIGENVTATIETVKGNASGTYTSNADWTKGTIQFSDTGVVKVTVTDDNYCTPTELELEVVNAVNAISATSAKSNNVVLLNDVGLSTIEVSGGYTLYGNGFKMTATNDVMYDAMGVGFVTLKNGTLDNVQIICPNFSYSIVYTNQIKNAENTAVPSDSSNDARGNVRSAVMADGNSKILNSYVHGGRAAIFLRSGNLLIDGSTISGGAAANIHAISAQSLTLRNVTMIQKPFQATVHDTNKTIMGFSGLFECDESGNSTPLILEGTLVQDAWINESYKKYAPSAASSIITTALSKTDYLHDMDGDGTKESLNLGFTYIPQNSGGSTKTDNITDNRTNKATVPYAAVDVGNVMASAKVYSYKNINGTSSDFSVDEGYAPGTQGTTAPTLTFTDTNADRVFETVFDTSDNRWESTLTVNLDNGNYTFSFDKLLALKHGQNLSYTVKTADDAVIDTSKSVALTASGVTEYVLTVTDGDATHTLYFILTATKTSIPEPEVADTTGGTPLLVVKSKNSDWSCAIPALEGIKIKYYTSANNPVTLDLATLTPTSTGRQNGTNNYWETTKDGYKLKVSCGYIHDTKQVYGMPVVVNNSGNKMYFTISSTNGYVSTSTSGRTVTLTYEFTDPNGKTLTFSKTWQFNYADYKDGTQYSYSDFVKGTLKAASSVCVTPDTLVTLADGTQKEIQYVRVGDEVLAWNFTTGKYEVMPVSLLQAHDTGMMDVLHLTFEDGTVLKVLGEHGVFDADLSTFVFVDKDDAKNYVGHKFVKADGDGFKTVKLVGYQITTEYTTAYTILSTEHYNVMLEDMFTVTPAHLGDNFFNPFDIGEDMKYDEAAVKTDIEKYGLYTYDDFSHVVTYEQFVALNLAQFKVSVGKGYITYEGLIYLIENFVNNEDFNIN